MDTNRLILYVHGMGGSAQEAEQFRENCNGYDILGVDYEGYLPWSVKARIREVYDDARKKYERVYVMANSIGAYFSMLALGSCDVAKAFFISPVLDMERVILDMMERAGVTEQELRQNGEITAPSGEVLSWEYLSFVRENPLAWNVPTEILYAGMDNIVSRQTVNEFVGSHNARLTIMENGEHWFHTEEQLAFLNNWMKEAVS